MHLVENEEPVELNIQEHPTAIRLLRVILTLYLKLMLKVRLLYKSPEIWNGQNDEMDKNEFCTSSKSKAKNIVKILPGTRNEARRLKTEYLSVYML